MGLRAKFLIIMLAFSIGPLVTLFLINQRVFIELGDDIFYLAKAMLLQTTAKELQIAAENYAANVNRELQFIEKAVRTCRDDLEKSLARKRIGETETGQGGVVDAIKPEMPWCHQKMTALHNDVVYIAVLLTDGSHITFPAKNYLQNNSPVGQGQAHARIAPKMQSGSTPWRLSLKAESEAGEGNTLILRLPIHHPDGAVLGTLVAGIGLTTMLETIRPSFQWSLYTTSLLLDMDASLKSSSDLPLVVGSRRPTSKDPKWKSEATVIQVAPGHTDGINALLKGAHYGQKGYVSLPYEGETSIWAFANTNQNLGIVNILSEREILYRIARAPERFKRWLALDSFLAVASVVLIMVIVATHRSKRMLTPFFSMVSSFRRVSEGDFSTRLTFKTKDERQMVADAFNTMVTDLEEGMRARQALEVAQEVQQNFVPQTAPRIHGMDVATTVKYCEETGGDYIDVLKTHKGKIGIVVGDVTGHGIGAALLMATVRALIRAHYETTSSLNQVLDVTNRNLAVDMGDTGRFVTLFMMEFDPHAGQLKWVRAGHDPAWLFQAQNGSVTALNGPGMALGVYDEYAYSENLREGLVPGDLILIGTDGIWETTNSDGNFFGKHRLEKTVQLHAGKPSVDICDAVMQAIRQFRGEERQADDISIVVAKVLA